MLTLSIITAVFMQVNVVASLTTVVVGLNLWHLANMRGKQKTTFSIQMYWEAFRCIERHSDVQRGIQEEPNWRYSVSTKNKECAL